MSERKPDMAATDADWTAIRQQTDAQLAEIYQRLVDIHYALAEAPRVDQDLHRRTLQRLEALLDYVDHAVSERGEVAR
jgi:hypothetical protein